jgi:hypothetical protein
MLSMPCAYVDTVINFKENIVCHRLNAPLGGCTVLDGRRLLRPSYLNTVKNYNSRRAQCLVWAR